MRTSTLARHPLAIVGAVDHHGIGRGVHHAGDRDAGGDAHQPVRGSGRLHRHPCRVRDGAAAHPGGHVARATKTASRSRRRSPNGPSSIFVAPTCDERAPHHGAHRRQRHHRPAGGVRWPARDGDARFLRTGVPHADAPAVPGLAGRGACRRPLCRLSHRRRGGGIRAREAFRRTTAADGRHQYLSEADSSGRQDASWRPGGNVHGLPPARTRRSAIASASSANMPTTKPTPRR